MLKVNVLAGFGGKSPAPSGGAASDPDAQAFLTATGIVDPTIADAIDDLVIALKAAGVWAKCHAIYPFVGGAGATHAVNLKSPGTFDITWSGTLIHDANGVTGGGGHGNTGFNPSTGLASAHDNHLGIYSRSANSGGAERMELGSSDGSTGHIYMGCGVAFVGGNAYTNNGNSINASSGGGQGFIVSSRRANNDLELYDSGASIGTNTGTSSGISPNLNMFIMAVNASGFATFQTNKNVAFGTIGTGLTDAEVADYHTSVEAFQDALGRGVV